MYFPSLSLSLSLSVSGQDEGQGKEKPLGQGSMTPEGICANIQASTLFVCSLVSGMTLHVEHFA